MHQIIGKQSSSYVNKVLKLNIFRIIIKKKTLHESETKISDEESTRRIPEISSRHCLAVLLYTHSPLVGLRQGSAGATMVQSFSENVLEPERTKNTHGGYECRLQSLV